MSQQIDRTLDILELMIECPDGLALGELALRLDLPKSTAHRLLAQLVDRGYLEREATTQHYRLTMRLTVLGFRYLAKTGLTDICQPELDDLAAQTGELVRIAMVDHDTLTWVAQAQGARYGLRYDGNIGRRVILPATATGKAWLSTMSDERAVEIVLKNGFGEGETLGPNAIKTMSAFLHELGETRQRGYGLAWEEGEPGIAAVAAPIMGAGPDGACVGTLSVAGPTVRQSRETLAAIAPEVLRVARRLGELWPVRRHQPTAMVPGSFEDIRRSA